MVEQKEKKYPWKFVGIGAGVLMALVFAGRGVADIVDKHIEIPVARERFLSRLENISLEDLGRLYNLCRIDVKVNGGYLLEGIGNLFRGYD